ncbi:MAG: GNAT family N-acetyltransferase, partial [Pseudomonadota bacterium]|nr:GNAT family N-acetyltransferase [Pseudomonadota bacterium]
DVYVDPDHRRKGIARKLVEYLAAIGQEQDWARIYWLAEQDNTAAQSLYKNVGIKLDFTLHVMPL